MPPTCRMALVAMPDETPTKQENTVVEYFHIYVNGGLTYVGLVLSQAVQVMDKLKADGNEPVMKSYMLDPAVLEAMSQSYDDERLAD